MKLLRVLYVQVLLAIALGILVGAVWPHVGVQLKPLGDGFIKLVRMIIAVIIFCTVASGIAHMSDMKKFGRVGGKALIYFEVISTFALAVGLVVGEVLKPGRGFNINPATLDAGPIKGFVAKAHAQSVADHLLGIIPDTFVGAFAAGDLLQVLLLAILTGFALTRLPDLGPRVAGLLEDVLKVFFSILHLIVRLAPIGAFGAMGFTIGMYGIGALLFVLIVLGTVAWLTGFSILRFIAYIREELLIVLGTSSSETVLPQMMEKMQRLGAPKGVGGLVIPAGYSFSLDGTNIYMTLATLFLAQATNTHLSLAQELTLLLVAMLTSKGASGVTGAGFITLAATLAVVPTIPIQALAVLIGVDRFMSECRALTNVVGNGVAALVVARWEGELDGDYLRAELKRGPGAAEREMHDPADETEALRA